MPSVRSFAGTLTASEITIELIQQSTTLVQTTSVTTWTPSTTTLSGVLSGSLVLAIGGWWDGNANTGNPQGTPTNSNGTFTKSGDAAPDLPDGPTPAPGWPVAPEICHILSANSGSHVITPQNIDTSGDGYFFGLEFSAPGSTWSLVDSGYAFNGSGTAGAVDGVTVTTTGTAAQPGDLIVVAATLDGDPNSSALGSPTSGSWTNLHSSAQSSINIGLGSAYRICTSSGAQSATWAFNDAWCEICNAVIAVFRAS